MWDALNSLNKEEKRTLRVCKKSHIDFWSNDYLGIARDSTLYQSTLSLVTEKMEAYGICTPFGSTGSRLVSGHSLYTAELEQKIGSFHGYEACLVHSSGYMANIALLASLKRLGGTVFYDSLSHASTKDGVKLSTLSAHPFRHNDLEHLDKLLQRPHKKPTWILCETICSTSGLLAPIQQLVELAKGHAAHLIVDEAHSAGLYGPSGQGLIFQLGLQRDIFCQIITYGKAFGVSGAAILGSHDLREHIINFSHPFICTTAPSLLQQVAIEVSYKKVMAASFEREKLFQLSSQAQQWLQHHASHTHIQPIRIDLTKNFSERLQERGFSIALFRSPTVRRGEEILRISLHSFNHAQELQALFEFLEKEGALP